MASRELADDIRAQAGGVAAEEPQAVNVGWAPWPGGQTQFLSCPIREIFAEGNRGGGKTEIVLVKYLAEVGKHGDAWRGIIFRREYKHLDDLVAKSKRLFRKLGVKARWLSSKGDYKWIFPTGEELLFRAMKDPDDYWNYHGHEYPFIGWEELTNYPDDRCYEAMRSTNRCSEPGVPRFYVSTGNPFGAGHGWVKQRFIDIGPPCTVVTDDRGNKRTRIHIDLEDNRSLIENDPEYLANLEGIENEALRRAWRDGDWDIAVGGFLQGIWDPAIHVVDDFPIPPSWHRFRAMDWGFGKPYSIGWYAIDPDTGIIYRYRELYGWGGKPNVGSRESPDEVAVKIRKIEAKEVAAGHEFRKCPADTNIWAGTSVKRAGEEVTVAELMKDEGIRWIPAKKGPGSRVSGAQVVIKALKQGQFKVFKSCKHFIRTVPVLMPDENNWEDVDTEMEDHTWDEFRYALVSRVRIFTAENAEDSGPEPGSFDWLCQYGQEPKKKSMYRST